MGLPAALGTNVGRKWENTSCPSQRDHRESSTGGSGAVLGSHCPEYRGDVLCMGQLPAMAGNLSSSPLSPHFLLQGGRAAPKAFGSVPEPPGKGELLWEMSLTLQPLWQLCCCSEPWAQPLAPAPCPPGAFSPCKASSASTVGAGRVSCHPIPSAPGPLPSSLHLQDRGCDFPLTLATAVTRNCRAGSKLQIQRDKDYFPQKRGENCCICKDFPGPVPSRAHLSGVTPSFKHPSFHSLSRNHLH